MLSKKAKNLKTSPTLFLVAKAKELQAQGHDVISLTVGEPDWPTFSIAAEAGIEAIKKGITKYTPANGTIELRKVIVEKNKFELGISYTLKEVTVGSGAKFIIFAALAMLCDPEDEVILATPYWVSYPTMIELADGKPVIVECGENENFKLSAENLEKAITPKTKAFLFCSPSNPTSLVYTKDELKKIAEVLKKYPHIYVISDDMYNRLVFDGNKVAPHILHVAPELKNRVIAVNGGSKAYSMTGWRIGWAAGPEAIIKAMGDYQSQTTGSPSSISQYAVEQAIVKCENEIEKVVNELKQRKTEMMNEFAKISELKVFAPDGAFYFWIDIKRLIGKKHKEQIIAGSKDFCDILLNQYFVAIVPGIECGAEGYVRMSFAASLSDMKKALVRIKHMLLELT